MLLWSILAPQTPEGAHARFVRMARRRLARIAAPGGRLGLVEFNKASWNSLDEGVRPFAGTTRCEMNGDIIPVARKTGQVHDPGGRAFHFLGIGLLDHRQRDQRSTGCNTKHSAAA